MSNRSIYCVAPKRIRWGLRTLLYLVDAIRDCGAAKQLSARPLKRCHGLFFAPHPWSLAWWMPLQKQCEPRLGASNARFLRSRETPESRQLHSTYLTAPHPFLISSILLPGTSFRLRRKSWVRNRRTLLFTDYGISVVLVARR